MKYRILLKTIKRAMKTFPAVVVTGPRQSGKTTLLKSIFGSKYVYLNLENSDIRLRAKEDPKQFLGQYQTPIIIDEIQYVPELLSYIKTRIDNDRKPGQWFLTGSQNFVLMKGVSQSLAGRAAILSLLPFSYSERNSNGQKAIDTVSLFKKIDKIAQEKTESDKYNLVSELLIRGNYPEIATNKKVDSELWCSSYITTYLERDIRNLSSIGDLGQFERFLRLCAIRTGQILNLTELSKEIGVSLPTVNRWISMLQTGYQIFLLYPFYRNIGKRIVKSPKLYFNDTALVCYLLGINNKSDLLNSLYFPHIFETYIVIDFLKRYLHFGQLPSLYYLKTRDGLEIDLIVEINQKLNLIEIKSGSSISSKHAVSLVNAQRDLGKIISTSNIISLMNDNCKITTNVKNIYWQSILNQ